MLLVSLSLAGLAITISLFALALAVHCDLRDRDRRRGRAWRAVPTFAPHPTLRLWEPWSHTSRPENAPLSAFVSARGPDLVVGGLSGVSEKPADGEAPQRKAA